MADVQVGQSRVDHEIASLRDAISAKANGKAVEKLLLDQGRSIRHHVEMLEGLERARGR